MKKYKDSNNEIYAFEDDCFDEKGNCINEIVKKIALKFGVSSDYILELEDIRPHFIFFNKGLPIDKVAHIQFLIKDMEELYSKSEEITWKSK